MPNWVYNGLTIEGKPESVKSLMTQMNKPFKQKHDSWNMETQQMEIKETLYPNPVFAFHNIYNHTEAGITDEEYLAQPPRSSDQDWFKFDTNDWYNFNVREWGTKWDVGVSAYMYQDIHYLQIMNILIHICRYTYIPLCAPFTDIEVIPIIGIKLKPILVGRTRWLSKIFLISNTCFCMVIDIMKSKYRIRI